MSLPTALYKIKRDGSAFTTLLPGRSGLYFASLVEDKSSGDFFIGNGDSTNSIVMRADRTSMTIVRTIAVPAPAKGVWALSQDPHNTDIYASSEALHRIDPANGTVITLSTGVAGSPARSW